MVEAADAAALAELAVQRPRPAQRLKLAVQFPLFLVRQPVPQLLQPEDAAVVADAVAMGPLKSPNCRRISFSTTRLTTSCSPRAAACP